MPLIFGEEGKLGLRHFGALGAGHNKFVASVEVIGRMLCLDDVACDNFVNVWRCGDFVNQVFLRVVAEVVTHVNDEYGVLFNV